MTKGEKDYRKKVTRNISSREFIEHLCFDVFTNWFPDNEQAEREYILESIENLEAENEFLIKRKLEHERNNKIFNIKISELEDALSLRKDVNIEAQKEYLEHYKKLELENETLRSQNSDGIKEVGKLTAQSIRKS